MKLAADILTPPTRRFPRLPQGRTAKIPHFPNRLPGTLLDQDDLRTAHEAGVVDFANRAGFGYVAGRERVLGFQPHGFRTAPDFAGASNPSARWQMANLELVSLLKHETPLAYVSKNMPRMDELADAPTRSLDDFEIDALRQLRLGDELVVVEQTDELRMLGSLRAAKQCTECHAVQRGDLLGAFT